MKFIIRDDDVNATFDSVQLENWYKGIFEICPISILAVPFIKGDYFKWVHFAEKDKDGYMAHKNEFYDDDEIHRFEDNEPLVQAIKKWQKEGKAKVSMHGIHHRNWDRNAPDMKDNYSTGAEFWTDNDMTGPLIEGKEYLESIFGQKIKAFAAPQNEISFMSYKSLRNAGLSVNCNYYLRNINESVERYGLFEYIRQLYLKVFKYGRELRYPYMIRHNGFNIVANYGGMYPGGKDLESIKRQIDFVHSKNGIFVFTTHSYGFDYKLPQCGDITIKEAIVELLEYTQTLTNVEYTTLEDIFD